MASPVFDAIYSHGLWGNSVIPGLRGGSGEGSDPTHARPYMEFLQKFLKERNIQSVVDLGSGDWQFSRQLDWTGIKYLGIDCVQSVVSAVSTEFAKPPNITFTCLDFCNNPEFIPSADLCILKDVIQHWPNAQITAFLSRIIQKKLFKYILITNCFGQTSVDRPIEMGGFLPLSPFLLPMVQFSPQPVLQYSTKMTCLITVS
jgi:SAM-dependent methyltransferase